MGEAKFSANSRAKISIISLCLERASALFGSLTQASDSAWHFLRDSLVVRKNIGT